jgi:hypothetical protein
MRSFVSSMSETSSPLQKASDMSHRRLSTSACAGVNAWWPLTIDARPSLEPFRALYRGGVPTDSLRALVEGLLNGRVRHLARQRALGGPHWLTLARPRARKRRRLLGLLMRRRW